MNIALEEAKKAAQKGEVPVGAVLIDAKGTILSATHNQTIQMRDPSAHAEMLAIREAAQQIQNYRLLGTTLYATIEPCIMCMGALVHARIATLVFGTSDPKWGAAGSLYHFSEDKRLNHHPEVIKGVCEAECRDIIQIFFRQRRG